MRDEQAELARQLELVRRRVDGAVVRLSRARAALRLEEPHDAAPAAPAASRGDLFLLCVRLEVALAESAETADKLAASLHGSIDAVPQDGGL